MRRMTQWLRLWLVMALMVISGCHPPRSADDVVSVTTAAYNLGCVALEVATAASTTWLETIDAPTETDIARGKQVVAMLVTARSSLTRAHTLLNDGREALQDVRQALLVLRAVTSMLGSQAPPGLETALTEAEQLVGGER